MDKKPRRFSVDPGALALRSGNALHDRMSAQHPFHEQLAQVYEAMGGLAALQDWAEENQGAFFNMMMKAAPPPIAGGKGSSAGMTLNLSLHPALAPGPLDTGVTLDHDDTN